MSKASRLASRGRVIVVVGAVAVALAYWASTRESAAPVVVVGPDELVAAARVAGSRGDYATGQARIGAYRAEQGLAPEVLEAQSWLARSALAAGDLGRAEDFAQQTYDLAQELLASRPLDLEPRLPTALGAAIEVLGQAGASRGARAEAVAFLEREHAHYRDSSIAMRIQKNINLISLEGRRAPALDLTEFIGTAPPTLASLEGDVLLLFFWAHWCTDCKALAPVLQTLADRYGGSGFRIVAPTQRYGYVAGGVPAPPDVERRYIEDIRAANYPMLAGVPMPLSAANHERYGVSTTPTLALVDRAGVVRLYHPGLLSESVLDATVAALVDESATAPSSSD